MNAQARIERQILALHQAIAALLRAGDRTPLARAQSNLQRWQAAFGGELPPAYREWRDLLAGPSQAWLGLLEEHSERATRLRSNSPFAGAIGARERWRIFRDAT
ncbi:MAG: hypothetical protein AB7V26_13525 [Lysobacterales bacterium]